MTLLKGLGTVRKNVTELMKGIKSPARMKAVNTIAKSRNVNRQQAQYTQAVAIAKNQARKK